MNNSRPYKQKVNILLVDDDEEDFILFRYHIDQIPKQYYDFSIAWVREYLEAVDKICSGHYDVFFVDYNLGVKTGLDLIKELINNKCQQPIVLLTGIGSREIDMQAMQAGASDYLNKSELNPEKMERCIRYAMSRYNLTKTLSANEQKYRGLFEKSKDLIFVTDMDLYFREVNDVCSEMLGYTKAALEKMNISDILADSKDAGLIQKLVDEQGAMLDRELTLITCENKPIYTLLSIAREKDAGGNCYLQGIIHDITSLKKAELITLQTEKFQTAERLVRMLAHEVRNPLNNILLAQQQLNNSGKDKLTHEFLQIIRRNALRINTLISELMEAPGSAPITKETFALQTILSDSIQAASDRIALKHIKLETDFPEDNVWIRADAKTLKIAFLNIIINAIEAAPEVSGRLHIRIERLHSEYKVIISDNGHGIKEEDVNRIFDPYFTSKSNGMGLGLTSVFNILQSHGAAIDVLSKIGEGTSFSIHFLVENSLQPA